MSFTISALNVFVSLLNTVLELSALWVALTISTVFNTLTGSLFLIYHGDQVTVVIYI